MTSFWTRPEAWAIALAATAAIVAVVAAARFVLTADPGHRDRLREACAGLAQYTLLFGFAAVAAAISAHGLIGFARGDMRLRGAWPFLLWAALDGAAGLCAVLLMRRAARGESAVAPRLAVWGLVAASSAFNWAHAPDRPGAQEAFALMPVIAAVLFEFSLHETRHTAGRSERRMGGLRWLRPGERIRVQLELAGDESLTVQAATRQVRVRRAAWALHRLRQEGGTEGRGEAGSAHTYQLHRAERRAQKAITRAGFADRQVAGDVLRQARMLALTAAIASLSYPEPGAGTSQLELADFVPVTWATDQAHDGSGPAQPAGGPPIDGHLSNGYHAASRPDSLTEQQPQSPDSERPDDAPGPADRLRRPFQPAPADQRSYSRQVADHLLAEAGHEIVAYASEHGDQLTKTELARLIRLRGMSIANDRLQWLADASGLVQMSNGQR